MKFCILLAGIAGFACSWHPESTGWNDGYWDPPTQGQECLPEPSDQPQWISSQWEQEDSQEAPRRRRRPTRNTDYDMRSRAELRGGLFVPQLLPLDEATNFYRSGDELNDACDLEQSEDAQQLQEDAFKMSRRRARMGTYNRVFSRRVADDDESESFLRKYDQGQEIKQIRRSRNLKTEVSPNNQVNSNYESGIRQLPSQQDNQRFESVDPGSCHSKSQKTVVQAQQDAATKQTSVQADSPASQDGIISVSKIITTSTSPATDSTKSVSDTPQVPVSSAVNTTPTQPDKAVTAPVKALDEPKPSLPPSNIGPATNATINVKTVEQPANSTNSAGSTQTESTASTTVAATNVSLPWASASDTSFSVTAASNTASAASAVADETSAIASDAAAIVEDQIALASAQTCESPSNAASDVLQETSAAIETQLTNYNADATLQTSVETPAGYVATTQETSQDAGCDSNANLQ